MPPRRPHPVRLWRTLLVLTACCLLAGCLVPDRYKATLSLSNNAYSLDFIGEMHIMAAYTDLFNKGGHNDPEQVAAQVVREFERVIRERQQASVETRLVSPRLFQASFLYVSPYSQPEATGMFQMQVSGDTLTLTSRPLSAKDKEVIRLNNITSRGQLCIKAFGTVLESNAQRSATLLDRCNVWDLDGLDEPVRMVVKFSKPIPGGGPPAP